MQAQWYTQCLMKKGNSYRVGWIPNDFGKEGRIVDLKLNSKWSKGWKVIQAGILLDGHEVKAREMDYRHQREASDI